MNFIDSMDKDSYGWNSLIQCTAIIMDELHWFNDQFCISLQHGRILSFWNESEFLNPFVFQKLIKYWFTLHFQCADDEYPCLASFSTKVHLFLTAFNLYNAAAARRYSDLMLCWSSDRFLLWVVSNQFFSSYRAPKLQKIWQRQNETWPRKYV